MIGENIYEIEVTAKRLPKACIECPFYIANEKTWMCFLSENETESNGSQEKRLSSCKITLKKGV